MNLVLNLSVLLTHSPLSKQRIWINFPVLASLVKVEISRTDLNTKGVYHPECMRCGQSSLPSHRDASNLKSGAAKALVLLLFLRSIFVKEAKMSMIVRTVFTTVEYRHGKDCRKAV